MSFRVLESARIRRGPMASDASDGNNGAFDFASVEPGWRLAVIASAGTEPEVPKGLGWEHVSVHAYRGIDGPTLKLRTPTWKEMCQMKAEHWDDEDVVMQLHPRRSAYVNNHPHVLHLWRSTAQPIPEPPSLLVGVLDESPAADNAVAGTVG